MVFDIIEHLQIRPELKESILEFRKQYPVEPQFQSRIPVPSNIYYGTDIWEKSKRKDHLFIYLKKRDLYRIVY